MPPISIRRDPHTEKQNGGGPRSFNVFGYAEALLGGRGAGGAPLPPKVSAAMYRVIARLPACDSSVRPATPSAGQASPLASSSGISRVALN